MTLVDRIAEAQQIIDAFDLVNEFLSTLQHTSGLQKGPLNARPARSPPHDVSYWLMLVLDEIERQVALSEDTPDGVFALRAVLETAMQKPACSTLVSLRLSASQGALAAIHSRGKQLLPLYFKSSDRILRRLPLARKVVSFLLLQCGHSHSVSASGL